MGVGTYSSDFNGTGHSFNVSGPLWNDEDYSEYLATVKQENPQIIVHEADDGDWNFRHKDDPQPEAGSDFFEIGSFAKEDQALIAAFEKHDISYSTLQQWGQDQYDDFNLHLVNVVEEAGRELGMDVTNRKGFSADSSAFDKEFVNILESKYVAVGWRSWEHDFVIGVGANANENRIGYFDSPEYNKREILTETGRSSEQFTSLYQSVTDKVSEYVRLSLMNDEIKCSYKTSGYTSKEYAKEEGIEEKKLAIKEELKTLMPLLELTTQNILHNPDETTRLNLIQAINSFPGDDEGAELKEMYMTSPVYDHVKDCILWVDSESSVIVGVSSTNDPRSGIDLTEFVQSLPDIDGLSAIPRCEATEAYFVNRQALKLEHSMRGPQHPWVAVVSGQEYTQVTGKKFEISFDRFESSSHDVFSDAYNYSSGVNYDAEKLKLMQGEANKLLDEVKNSSDARDVKFKNGLVAVISLLHNGNQSHDTESLGRKILSVLNIEDGDNDKFVTLLTSNKPSLKP